MRRREFITLLGGVAAWPVAARAQQAGPVRLIGVLMGFAENDLASQSDLAEFRGTLAKLGWMEGKNIRSELRWGAGDPGKIGTFAKELVDLHPDAILSVTTLATRALARETRTIPIVFTIVSDPIGSGFAASLTRPGGNITGFTNIESTKNGKWVGILKEIAPRTVRAALLFNPSSAPPLQFFMPSIQAASSSYAVQASAAPVLVVDEIEGVVAAQAGHPGGALIAMPDSFNVTNRELIIALAARYGVPAIFDNRLYTESGGLIAYGVDFVEQFRLAAGYTDRILKGDKPADLPIQLPTKFELTINLKTAKALGLEIPPTLLARADEVIE
jgi:putative tryptophan/tyrosine transport system substrate-binding protein